MSPDIAGCKAALAHLDLDDNPATVKQKSRDFFWYSPVLKARMDHLTADFVVAPKSEAEVIEALAAAHAHDVPVTTRGAGTGNYGQAMPLSGGMVLHLKHMTAIRSVEPGRLRAEAGAIMAHLDRELRPHGQELRLHPSTVATATLGGFIAGGSGGVGSIRWGGLRDPGNILSLTLITCEAEPRVIELTGEDINKANHAYGVNGVITEVEVPLGPAYDWVDLLIGFEDWERANRFADLLANQDAILLKELGTVAAPVGHDYFLRHKKFIRREQSVVVAMVAPQSLDAVLMLAARQKDAEILYNSDRDPTDGLPPAYELAWNHTTLRALRVDPSITYLQVLYGAPDHVEKITRMAEIFGDEVPGHVEFVRMDGKVRGAGLPLVRFTDEERLEEIMRIHEAEGCPIFNPHRYTLEEGGMKRTDPLQLAFKRETDPKGLLNPGKMIAWDDPDYDFESDQLYLFPGMTAPA
jgi:FAD/FMN-containing dehydrogenase